MTNAVLILTAQLMTASWYHSPYPGLTCATRDYPIGAQLRVTEIHNGLSVVVTVKERGPAKRLVAQGVRIDLCPEAFEKLDGLGLGHADVRVQQL